LEINMHQPEYDRESVDWEEDYEDEPEMVTQAELEEYARVLNVERQRAELRDSIVQRIRAGAQIERGPYTAEVKLTRRVIVSGKSLRLVVGHAEYQRIQEAIEPTVCQTLRVQKGLGRSRPR
jgi:hypothetical protein